MATYDNQYLSVEIVRGFAGEIILEWAELADNIDNIWKSIPYGEPLSKKFVVEDGLRWYKTGDLVRYNSAGIVEYPVEHSSHIVVGVFGKEISTPAWRAYCFNRHYLSIGKFKFLQ